MRIIWAIKALQIISNERFCGELGRQQTLFTNSAKKVTTVSVNRSRINEDNDMMNINEEQVRKHAYQIWESEGRPQNQATRHWEMAQKMAATQNQLENQDRSNTSKAKTRSAKASSAEKLSVKEPSI